MWPKIININSQIDVLQSVESAYLDLDFEAIRKVLCPLVRSQDWTTRLNELGCIALISQLFLKKAYANANFYEDTSEQRRPWPKQETPRDSRNEVERQPPKRGEGTTIVEALGIYVGSLKNFMISASIEDSAGILNSKFSQQPAILLCPEAMTEFARELYTACQHLQHPFDSEQEAFAFILNSVLVHEFGHHFLPTQKCGGERYLNEGLANLFALYGLKHGMRTNSPAVVDHLTYKTFLLQDTAYSAYRPLNALFEVDPHTRFVVGMCFSGDTSQWASLRGKPCQGFRTDLGASRQMGIRFDYEASQGLWYDEIGGIIGRDDPWLGSFWGEGLEIDTDYLLRNITAAISPDFLADLYERRNLNRWMEDKAYAFGIMNEAWGYRPESSWPNDCLDWKGLETLANLSDCAATVCLHCQSSLDFSSLKQLSDSAANILGKSWQAKFYGIEMPKLNTLSSTAAAGLCGTHRFFLRLPGLTAIPDDTAKSLGKHRGELSLLKVSSLSDRAAEYLAKVDGALKLNGLTILTDKAAEHLGNHRGDLSLDGLTIISDAAAEGLSRHKGALSLQGLRNLTDAAAESLGRVEGRVILHGFCELSATGKKHLKRQDGG